MADAHSQEGPRAGAGSRAPMSSRERAAGVAREKMARALFERDLDLGPCECKTWDELVERGWDEGYLDDADKLLAALAGEGREPEWRPIKTAPKDETHILAWFHDDSPLTAHWGEYQSGPSIAYWAAHNGGGWVSNRHGEPTHWMPLPDPPRALPDHEKKQPTGDDQ